jgi:hypothetical protein
LLVLGTQAASFGHCVHDDTPTGAALVFTQARDVSLRDDKAHEHREPSLSTPHGLVALHPWHVPEKHKALAQSCRVAHFLLSAQRRQLPPPQSTSLSVPFWSSSLQVGRLGQGSTHPNGVGGASHAPRSIQVSPGGQSPQVVTKRRAGRGLVAPQKGAPSAVTAHSHSWSRV